jgi:hypothetical protein
LIDPDVVDLSYAVHSTAINVIDNDVTPPQYTSIGIPENAIISVINIVDGTTGTCEYGEVIRSSSSVLQIYYQRNVGTCVFRYPVCGEADSSNTCTDGELTVNFVIPTPTLYYNASTSIDSGSKTYTATGHATSIFDGDITVDVVGDMLNTALISIVQYTFDPNDRFEYVTVPSIQVFENIESGFIALRGNYIIRILHIININIEYRISNIEYQIPTKTILP